MRPQKIILLQGGGGGGQAHQGWKGGAGVAMKQSNYMIWVAAKHKTEEKL